MADVTAWSADTGKWVTFKRAQPKPLKGDPEPMVFNGYRISQKIPSQPLGETLKKILALMADGTARPPAEISDVVGVTAATVRYHLVRRDEFEMIGKFVRGGGGGRPVEFWQMNLDE